MTLASRQRLEAARTRTILRLEALLPDVHPSDVASICAALGSIAARERWSSAEMEALVRKAEASTRKDKRPVTAEEAATIRAELQDQRSF